jgi:hypothetical protein
MDKECYICLNNKTKKIINKCNCIIYVHYNCHKKWLEYNSKCIICNEHINKYDISYLYIIFIVIILIIYDILK